ncbi:hypothetical protein [Hymenobacter rubripertinctus]|uniref:hypothetical protein n=1 Tax=Hymenobacter rubripertinctus TaxID=2029981 RepID=UPI0011C40B82|nr:hypothetical protein [Hymenobacter rubripertinctus]
MAELDKIVSEEKQIILKKLIGIYKINGIDLVDEMIQVSGKIDGQADVVVSLRAFNGIDNIDWKIKIYIPSYNDLKDQGKLLNGKYSLFSYAGENDKDFPFFNGYKYDNKFEKIFINEKYVNKNPVIIISLDEKINRDEEDKAIKNYSSTSNRPTGTTVNAAIGLMSVKEKKESWPAGASDIAIAGSIVWNNASNTNPFNPPAPNDVPTSFFVGSGLPNYDFNGSSIRDFSRKEVDKQTWVDVNARLVSSWNPYWYPSPGYKNSYDRDADHAFYIVYEADPWPTGERTASFQNNLNLRISYRSDDGVYIQEIITRDQSIRTNSDNPWYSTGDFGNPFFYQGHQVIVNSIQYQVGDERY